MFGKAKCKLCGKKVRFAIRHLKNDHLDEFSKITKLDMSKIMKNILQNKIGLDKNIPLFVSNFKKD